MAEAEKRPWDSVRDGRGGMSGREASERKGSRSIREGQRSESPGPRTHGVARRAQRHLGREAALWSRFQMGQFEKGACTVI